MKLIGFMAKNDFHRLVRKVARQRGVTVSALLRNLILADALALGITQPKKGEK